MLFSLFVYYDRQSRKSMPNAQTVQRFLLNPQFLPMKCRCISTTMENTKGCFVGHFHTGRGCLWNIRRVFPGFWADTDIARKDEMAWTYKVYEDGLSSRSHWNGGALGRRGIQTLWPSGMDIYLPPILNALDTTLHLHLGGFNATYVQCDFLGQSWKFPISVIKGSWCWPLALY